MNKLNVIAIDLAKIVFQVAVLNRHQKVLCNKTLRSTILPAYLARQPKSLVAIEACGRAHHWARIAQSLGHDVVILPARIVSAFRQGHKTDSNDALAIALSACQPSIKAVAPMSLEQQSLQTDQRIAQHASDGKTATGNMIRGLLAEFGLEIAKGDAHLKRAIPLLLEDAENGLPLLVRESLHQAWELWQFQAEQCQQLDKLLSRRAASSEVCRRLMALEGVGPKNAIGLAITLGCTQHFKNGRNAAACIGVTPKQHSSGGKVKIGHIGKYCGNQRLRSSLITGAHSVIQALEKRPPRNEKERWLQALIARRGKGRAAVALANKTVRTAWAMLHHNEPYKASLALAF